MEFSDLSPEQKELALQELRSSVQRGAKAVYRAVSDGRLEPGEDTASLFQLVDEIVPGTLGELRQEYATQRTKPRLDTFQEVKQSATQNARMALARRNAIAMGLNTDTPQASEVAAAITQKIPGVRNIAAGAESALMSLGQVGATLGELVGGDFAGESGESARFAAYRAELAKELAKDDPANPAIATLSRGVRSASESVSMAVPLGAVGGVPGVIAGFTLASGADALDEGRSAGLRGPKLAAYAATAAGIEAIVTTAFQGAGRGGFESLVAGQSGKQLSAQALKQLKTVHGAIRGLFKRVGEEQAEELAIYGLQEANRWAYEVMDEGKKPGDFAQEIIDLMVATAIGTGAVGSSTIMEAAQNQRQRAQLIEERQQQRAEFNEQRRTDRLTVEPRKRAAVEFEAISKAIQQEAQESEAALTREQLARAMAEGRDITKAQTEEEKAILAGIPDRLLDWLGNPENVLKLAAFEGPISRSAFKDITGIDKTSSEQRSIAVELAKQQAARLKSQAPDTSISKAIEAQTEEDLFSQATEETIVSDQTEIGQQPPPSQHSGLEPSPTEPTTPAAQSKQPDPPIESPIIRQQGRSHKLLVTGQPAKRAVYAVVKLSDLIPSHNEDRGFSPNERHPGNVRDYAANSQMQASIEKDARNLDPDRLLDLTYSNSLGPPVVDKNGIVLGGNSRTMKLLRALRLYPQKFAAYQQKLREEARLFGVNPESITDDAVLVRMVDLPAEEITELIRTLNDPEGRADSEAELAFKISKAIPPEVSRDFRINDDKTLRENLRQRGVGFFRNLVKQGVIPSNQESQYISEEGDRPALTSLALDTLENAMVARLIAEKTVYDAMKPQERQIVLRSAPVILNFHNEVENGRISSEADMLPHVPGAIRLARAGGMSIGQQDAFESGTPEEKALSLAYQYAWNNPGKTRELFSKIADALDNYVAATPGEIDIFGEPPKIDVASIIKDAVNAQLADDVRKATKDSKVNELELPEMGQASAGEFFMPWEPSMELDFGFAPMPMAPNEPARPSPRIFQLSDMVELVRSQDAIAAIKRRYAKSGTLGVFSASGKGVVSVRYDVFAGPVIIEGQASIKAFESVKQDSIRKSVARFLILHGADPKQVERYMSNEFVSESELEKPFLMRNMPDGFSAQIVPRTRIGESDIYIMKGIDEIARLVVTEGKGRKLGKRAIAIQRHMPEYANKIFAHEIGHMIDYLPEKTLKRGNILGRIASLQRYMKATLEGVIGTNKEIRDELIELTRWWSGDFDPKTPYGKYRQSSAELYAEAWSVLLNNPNRLQQMAPLFYDALMSNLSAKPEVLEEYNRINAEIGNGTSQLRPWQQLKEGRERGEQIIKDIAENKLKKTEVTATPNELFQEIVTDIHYATKARTRAVHGGLSNNVEDAIDTAVYAGAITEGYLNHLRRQVTDHLADNGISIDTFNEYLTILRILSERQDMANPVGITPESARARLREMKSQIGPDGMLALEEARVNFRRVRMDVIRRMEQSNAFNTETMKQIRENEYYTRFQVLQPLINELEGNNGKKTGAVSLAIQRQFGTFQDIAPPLQATAMYDVAIIRLITWNNAKMQLADYWSQALPQQIRPAQVIQTERGKEFIEPKQRDWGLITFKREGQAEGYYVPAIVARAFNERPTESMMAAARVFKHGANVVRALFTYRNPGHPIVAIKKDYSRFYNNIPTPAGTGRLKKAALIIKEMIDAQPEAWRREFGETPAEAFVRVFKNVFMGADIPAPKPKIGKTIGELLDDAVLIASYTDTRIAQEDLTMEGELKRINEMAQAPSTQKAIVQLFKSAWEFPVKLNGAAEATTKVAAYNYLKKHFPDLSDADRKYLIRHVAGSPSFITRGRWTSITNSIYIFSNAFVQANRSSARMLIHDPKEMAANYAASTFAPKMLQIAISSGAATLMAYALYGVNKDTPEEEKPYPVRWLEMLQTAYNKISAYDRSNYLPIPLYIQSDGRVAYLRIPMDESQRLLAHFMQAAFDVATNKKDASALFALGFDQIPGLNPILEVALNWQDFARGRNPYDAFRQRPMIDRDIFESDRTRAAIELAKETWNDLGGPVLYRFNTVDPPERMSVLEKIVTGPLISNIIGRWIKVSNQGDLEMYNRIANLERREEAAERTIIRDIVGKQIDGKAITEAEQQILDRNPERTERAIERIKVRESRDPLAKALLNAGSTTQRDAITLEASKRNPDLNIASYDPSRTRTMADMLTKPIPSKLREQQAWREERQAAIDWFRARNITAEQALEVMEPELQKLKDRRTANRKRIMIKRALAKE